MTYQFKLRQELIWVVVVAALGALAQALATTDPATVTDWRAWALSLGIAVVRAVVGALLAWLGGGGFSRG